MSVETSQIIDAISVNPEGIVVLTISDHLEWAKDNEHLILLENKINAYLGVIESDDIYEIYPSAIGKKFHIEIAFKFLPNDAANNFLTTVKRILLEAGYDLHYYHLSN